jgi:hypothetical protein
MEQTPEVDRVVEEVGGDGPKHRKSHQFRALSRRAATYHRRHWKLDLCCLGLCPAYKHIGCMLTVEYLCLLLEYSGSWLNTLRPALEAQIKLSFQTVYLEAKAAQLRGIIMFKYRHPNQPVPLPWSKHRKTRFNYYQWRCHAACQLSHRTFPNRQCLPKYPSVMRD